MNNTPIANRIHIGMFGRRNAGKSNLINAITNQNIAIVSDVPGTTTDPVIKAMELLPLGSIAIIDTAGLDDEGELGSLRIQKTYEVLRKTDVAILVISAIEGVSDFEINFVDNLKSKKIKAIGVLSKADLKDITEEDIKKIENQLNIPIIAVSSQTKVGVNALKELIAEVAADKEEQVRLAGDLVNSRDIAVLVTPIDEAAPKGRLILPQQQVIRDILDSDAIVVVTKEHELKEALAALNKKPAIVITDSQAFLKVSADTPEDIPLTSFSILFARYKGEIIELLKGIKAIENLKPGSKVLIAEGCTHHAQSDDIGTVKIPAWIRQMVGGEIEFEWMHGTQFTDDIEKYDVIVHCGGCMLNSREMKYRINHSKQRNVAITNYGMLIAYVHGILQRALKPFPEAYKIFKCNTEEKFERC